MPRKALEDLRKLMKENNLNAYIVPSSDPHQSEYVPACWERRHFLSGFTGSAGTVVVTETAAGLWTDSRYFLQAEEQLQGSGIELFKMGLPGVPGTTEWLVRQLKSGDVVGIDPRVFSYREASDLKAQLTERGIELRPLEDNLVDEIWADRPDFPKAPAKPHPLKFAGETVESKLARIREQMAEQQAEVHILTALDTIAWTFNIRGADVDYNPVVIAYAAITPNEARLFLPAGKETPELKAHLGEAVQISRYEDFGAYLESLAGSGKKVWLDPDTVSFWITEKLSGKVPVIFRQSPVVKFKALKNETEIAGMKAAHLRDGVAMVRFLYWLEKQVPGGKVTEISAAEKVEEFRREQENYVGPSFHPISAYGPHGAIVHYSADESSNAALKPEGIFLFDSGGQYLDGTTDITRTVALGKPTREQKEHFTRVLKGMLALSITRFPAGFAGNQLDTIARKPLWDAGLNYGHGTGHGVGAYLNVHEGPQGISYYRGIGVPMEPGMITSNEPGYYLEGAYGIRIENLVLTVPDAEAENFLTFETITLCPIDRKLILPELLSEAERAYLNKYHRRVREAIEPRLKDPQEKEWLRKATEPV